LLYVVELEVKMGRRKEKREEEEEDEGEKKITFCGSF